MSTPTAVTHIRTFRKALTTVEGSNAAKSCKAVLDALEYAVLTISPTDGQDDWIGGMNTQLEHVLRIALRFCEAADMEKFIVMAEILSTFLSQFKLAKKLTTHLDPPTRTELNARDELQHFAKSSAFDFDPCNPPKKFKNIMKAKQQSLPFACQHNGDCNSSACACSNNQTNCRGSCDCALDCTRRFPSCNCNPVCNDSCICIRFGRECTYNCRSGSCSAKRARKRGQCYNVFHEQDMPQLIVKQSTLPTAGLGLFSGDFIKANRWLGQYYGPLTMHDNLSVVRSEKISLFQITKDASIDPQHDPSTKPCLMFYINHQPSHSQMCNAHFTYIEGDKERKIMVFASRDIEKGEEIFASYSLSDSWDFVAVDQYYYVRGKGRKNTVWIAKILDVLEDGKKFRVQWTWNPVDLPKDVQRTNDFCKNEILMTSGKENQDIIEKETLMGNAEVKERCDNFEKYNLLGWNRYYIPAGKIVSATPDFSSALAISKVLAPRELVDDDGTSVASSDSFSSNNNANMEILRALGKLSWDQDPCTGSNGPEWEAEEASYPGAKWTETEDDRLRNCKSQGIKYKDMLPYFSGRSEGSLSHRWTVLNRRPPKKPRRRGNNV